MTVYEKGLITVLGCSILFVLIAIPLALRKVPRNIVYGFRTRTTLSDDFIWYEANAHFGRGLVIASIISSVTVLLLYRSRLLPLESFLMASIALLVIPSFVATVATFRYIRSLKRDPGLHGRHSQ